MPSVKNKNAPKLTLLKKRVAKWIGGIRLENYLSYMMIFRVAEILKINTTAGSGIVQYRITVLVVLLGASVFGFAFSVV